MTFPPCLVALRQQLADRWICFLRGGFPDAHALADARDDAVILARRLAATEKELVIVKDALAEALHGWSVAEANATRCDRDLADVLGLRGVDHPSFGWTREEME